MQILIVAGGQGTRLWPASTKSKPKQLLSFLNNKTLLENTYERFSNSFSDSVFIATTKHYAKDIQKTLPSIPKSHYSIEPTLKDRAPAIGLAALILHHHDPEAVFMTAWSDHYIKEEKKFINIIKNAERYLHKNPETTITIGIIPSEPHIGYGYIGTHSPIQNNLNLPLYKVKEFKEKPDLQTAQKYLRRGNYLWNSGSFLWKTKTLLTLFEKHLPEIYSLLQKILPYIGTKKQQNMINKIYPDMPKIEIEHGLIEKLDNLATIRADITWADVGNWQIIKKIQSPKGNALNGNVETINTNNSLIYNYGHGLVATIGISDLAVVVTDDTTLITTLKEAELIKSLITNLKSHPKNNKFV